MTISSNSRAPALATVRRPWTIPTFTNMSAAAAELGVGTNPENTAFGS